MARLKDLAAGTSFTYVGAGANIVGMLFTELYHPNDGFEPSAGDAADGRASTNPAGRIATDIKY